MVDRVAVTRRVNAKAVCHDPLLAPLPPQHVDSWSSVRQVLRDLQTQDQSSDNSDGGVQQVSVLRALLSDDPRATDL